MKAYIPYEKLSKKEKRRIDLKRRNSWGNIKPINIEHKSKKVYSRKEKHKSGLF